jgi:hypothetical protein
MSAESGLFGGLLGAACVRMEPARVGGAALIRNTCMGKCTQAEVTERLNKARKERAISSFQQQAPSAAKVGLCHPPPACRRLLGVHLLGRVSAGNV